MSKPTIIICYADEEPPSSLLRSLMRDTSDIAYYYLDWLYAAGDRSPTAVIQTFAGARLVFFSAPTSNVEFSWSHLEKRRDQVESLKPTALLAFEDHPIPASWLDLELVNIDFDYDHAVKSVRAMIDAALADVPRRDPLSIDLSATRPPLETSIIDRHQVISDRTINHLRRYPDEFRRIEPRFFEELVAELFKGFGYEVELTPQTRDGGRDIIATRGGGSKERHLIECKHSPLGKRVGVRVARELYAVKTDERATRAYLAITTKFTRDALLFFDRHKWELEPRDINGVLEWINQYFLIKSKGLSGRTEIENFILDIQQKNQGETESGEISDGLLTRMFNRGTIGDYIAWKYPSLPAYDHAAASFIFPVLEPFRNGTLANLDSAVRFGEKHLDKLKVTFWEEEYAPQDGLTWLLFTVGIANGNVRCHRRFPWDWRGWIESYLAEADS